MSFPFGYYILDTATFLFRPGAIGQTFCNGPTTFCEKVGEYDCPVVEMAGETGKALNGTQNSCIREKRPIKKLR